MILKSEIKEIGVLDPSTIDNSSLIDLDGNIKSNLHPNKDYITVHYKIWEFIWEKYGGGPIIKRADQNIYSDPVSTENEENEFNDVSQIVCLR